MTRQSIALIKKRDALSSLFLSPYSINPITDAIHRVTSLFLHLNLVMNVIHQTEGTEGRDDI